jgi:hypothetical protein
MHPMLAQVLDLRDLEHASISHKGHRSAAKMADYFFTCEATVLGSEVLPANTSMDKGIPAWSHNRPMTICIFPDLASRL